MSKRLLLLEFNELCPHLLDRWIGEGELPNFKRFRDASEAYVTVADADPPALEPWIQWYSMHTGLSYDQHGVFSLTDGPKAGHPDIWGILRDAGLRTASCCSMNTKGFYVPGSLYMADPWCTTEAAYPEELNIFHTFVSETVREYTNPSSARRLGDMARFMWFLTTHGLRARTVSDTVAQLCSEKLIDRSLAWRRPAVLDWMQRDVFLHYYKKIRPDFATLFLNSTAHLQHSYWRYMEPEHFEGKANDEDIRRYRGAILFGYKNMDRLLGDFFQLEDENVTLVLASALSQQPFLKHEAIGGQHFYRPRDLDRLLAELEVRPQQVQSVMTHQYVMEFNDMTERDEAFGRLKAVTCDGEEVFGIRKHSDNTLYFGCQLRTVVARDAQLSLSRGANTTQPFYEVFYLIEQTKSGSHHPDGVLWFKTGTGRIHQEKVSVRDVFPTLLDFFDVDYQPSEKHPFRGRSLFWDWGAKPSDMVGAVAYPVAELGSG